MTNEFIKCVPEEKWEFTHHPRFAPLKKQFIHIVKVYGCYINALETCRLDLKIKNTFYQGIGDRKSIQDSLLKLDQSLADKLKNLKESSLDGFTVDVFGIKMGFTEYTHVMIQHEVSHFGLWTNYAAFGEFQTPKMWQEEWKL